MGADKCFGGFLTQKVANAADFPKFEVGGPANICDMSVHGEGI